MSSSARLDSERWEDCVPRHWLAVSRILALDDASECLRISSCFNWKQANKRMDSRAGSQRRRRESQLIKLARLEMHCLFEWSRKIGHRRELSWSIRAIIVLLRFQGPIASRGRTWPPAQSQRDSDGTRMRDSSARDASPQFCTLISGGARGRIGRHSSRATGRTCSRSSPANAVDSQLEQRDAQTNRQPDKQTSELVVELAASR